jgi:hypothetical protein
MDPMCGLQRIRGEWTSGFQVCLFPTHTDLIFVHLEPNHQLLQYDMDLLKLIAMSPVVRVHPTTGPWWKTKAKALERMQYHRPLASLLGNVVAT